MIPLFLIAGVRWIGERFSGSPTDSLSRHLLLKPGHLEMHVTPLLNIHSERFILKNATALSDFIE